MCIKTLPVQQNVRKIHIEVRKREGKKTPRSFSFSLFDRVFSSWLYYYHSATSRIHSIQKIWSISLWRSSSCHGPTTSESVGFLFWLFRQPNILSRVFFYFFPLHYLLISYITQLALHQVLLVYLRPLLQFDLLLCYFLFFFSSYNHQWRNSKTSLYYFNNYFFLSFFIFMFFFACKFKCVWFAMACTHEQQQKN